MKKLLLSLVLCAFALSFSPAVALASAEVATSEAALPFFKKKKSNSEERYSKMKRNKKNYAKKRYSSRKKSKLQAFFSNVSAKI